MALKVDHTFFNIYFARDGQGAVTVQIDPKSDPLPAGDLDVIINELDTLRRVVNDFGLFLRAHDITQV